MIFHFIGPPIQQYSLRIGSENIRLYINGIIQFSEKYQDDIQSIADDSKTTILEKISIGYSYGLFPGIVFTPINFYYGMHWEAPCKPSLAGYWLLQECSPETWNYVFQVGQLQNYLGFGFKIGLLLFNQWVMSFGLYLCIFIVTGILIPCPFELCKFLDVYYKICGNTEKNIEKVYQTGLVYRNVQILLELLNMVQRDILLLNTFTTCTILPAMCNALLIRLPWTPENMRMISFSGTVVFECFMLTVASLCSLSKLYVKSIDIFAELKKDLLISYSAGKQSRLQVKWKQRFYKSCEGFQVRFDPLNGLDQETPLVAMDLVANLTVNFLLLT